MDEVIRDRMLAFAQELEAEADAQAWDGRSLELKSGWFSDRVPTGGPNRTERKRWGHADSRSHRPANQAATSRPASAGGKRRGRCTAPTPTPGSPR